MSRPPGLAPAILFLFALFLSAPLFAGNGGGATGGGHGGSGGHGGGHGHGGWHFGGQGNSGHSGGHSFGQVLGHLFGRRSGGQGSVLVKNAASRNDDPPRRTPAVFMQRAVRRRMLRSNRLFNSGFCDSLRFSWHDFLFPGDFACLDGGGFDPLFYGGSLRTDFWSDSLGNSQAWPESPESIAKALPALPDEPPSAAPTLSNVAEPVALLQLLDGSMYGLMRYWIEGTSLHYVTNYGGQNSVALDRIDFASTAKLNAARGTHLDLTRNLRKP
jgi:hypothetical protein